MKKGYLPSIKAKQNRISTSNVSRVPKKDVFCKNYENYRPILAPSAVGGMKHIVQLSKTRDRNIEMEAENPYDLPERLRLFSSKSKPRKIKPEPFIMGDIRTIVDVDSTFYEIIEGRPTRQFIDVKRYMREIRGVTIFRTDSAFSKDRILAIEDRQYNEFKEYTKILKMVEQTTSNFVRYVKQSYALAKAAQDNAEKVALELADRTDQLEAASFDYVRLRNYLCLKGANFEILVTYAKTLNSLAPPWWRDKYDYVSKIDNMSYIYIEQLMDKPAPARRESLSTLDGYEISVIKYKGTPRLFLKTPQQLMQRFVTFGEQCLNYIKIDVQTSVQRKNLSGALTAMRADFDLTVADIEDYVEMYNEKIKFYEERVEAYKSAFFKLLMGEFHDLYASYDNTKLFTCIQFVNTQVFNYPEDPNDSIMMLMSQLESFYLDITLELENLDQEVVKTATKISFERDIKEMNDAFRAQRVLKEFDILHKTLHSSYEPPRAITRPKIKWEQMKEKKKKGKKTKQLRTT